MRKKEEKEDNDKGYHRLERSYGSFCRTIPLPIEIENDKVKASYKKGILSITNQKNKKALEENQSGFAESAAGRALQKVLRGAQAEANVAFLQHLAKPKARFCITDNQCFRVTPEAAESFALQEAAEEYLLHRNKMDQTGLQYRGKDQPYLPQWMSPPATTKTPKGMRF